MLSRFIAFLYILVGLINIYPVMGVLGSERLTRLYDVSVTDPNLSILMRHRAILFGIIGGIIIYAAFDTRWRGLAAVIGLVSIVSFVILALMEGGFNDAIRRVVVADVVATVLMGVAIGLTLLRNTPH
jgi:hypothetical protein